MEAGRKKALGYTLKLRRSVFWERFHLYQELLMQIYANY